LSRVSHETKNHIRQEEVIRKTYREQNVKQPVVIGSPARVLEHAGVCDNAIADSVFEHQVISPEVVRQVAERALEPRSHVPKKADEETDALFPVTFSDPISNRAIAKSFYCAPLPRPIPQRR
jgi:hypothetical protein